MRKLPEFEPNPEYGSGAYRRRIRLRNDAGEVVGLLDDNNHAIWVRVRHSEGRVSDICGGFHRWPTNGCPSAGVNLKELVGVELTAPWGQLYQGGLPRRNCTHMFDLAALALRHAARDEPQRVWDAVVPDATGDMLSASVSLNGRFVHDWLLREDIIEAPVGLAGVHILKNFLPQAEARFSGDELEGALVLRMAAFVSIARRYVTDDLARPLRNSPARKGVCHAYSGERYEQSVQRIGTVVDMSAGITEQPEPPEWA